MLRIVVCYLVAAYRKEVGCYDKGNAKLENPYPCHEGSIVDIHRWVDLMKDIHRV